MTDKYVPESVRTRLVVGQRVRYVSDYECDHRPMPGSHAGKYGTVGHESWFNAIGKTGTIIQINSNMFPRHPYKVRIDGRYIFGGKSFGNLEAAAHELALVEDPD